MADARRQRGPAGWHFNMTPLIDVTFLLLTYFMLASHYASAEKPDIALPRPHESQAQDRPLQEKIYVNVLYYGPRSEPTLMLGPVRMESLDELRARLTVVGRADPQTQVVLRADRNVRYGEVRQVMEAVAAANLPRLQVVAELEPRP
ncbi:MAG: biopolymer transporter ExbD [Planctomycetes bacterium]|nr:biopolymer transporter ExbD [Planctomycetota bacterium]